MEEIKLPTVPELSLIPIERRNFPEADHKREKRKIQRKKKRKRQCCKRTDRGNGCQHDVNAVMAVIIYIPQAGPI